MDFGILFIILTFQQQFMGKRNLRKIRAMLCIAIEIRACKSTVYNSQPSNDSFRKPNKMIWQTTLHLDCLSAVAIAYPMLSMVSLRAGEQPLVTQ